LENQDKATEYLTLRKTLRRKEEVIQELEKLDQGL